MRPFPPPSPSRYLWIRIPKRLLQAVLAVFLLALCLHRPLLFALGRWLTVSEPIEKADVIVVLAGDSGGRVLHGVELYRRGVAPKILMSGGPIGLMTWAELMKAQAMGLGVPAEDIWIQGRSTSTTEDAHFSAGILRAQGIGSVCLATSNFHSRRSGMLFRRELGSGVRLGVDPEVPAWWNEDGWWKDGLSASIVFTEYVKLLSEAIGLGPT